MYQSLIKRFDSISFRIIAVLCAIAPIAFLTSSWGGTTSIKGFVLYLGVFLAASCWLLAQFVSGSIRIPKHAIFTMLGVWVLLAGIGALVSANRTVSLWGRGFALDSFATVLVLALFTFLIATFAREQKRLVTLFLSAFTGGVVTVLLQVILFVSQRATVVTHYFSHIATNGTLVGSWTDFAYFTTFTLILALLIYEVLNPKGFFKGLSLGAMVLSVIVLICLNFKAAWIIAIVSALLVFVYKSSVERSTSRFPVFSFATLIVGLFFFLSAGSIGASIARHVGTSISDIRPSLSTTTHVVRAVLLHDPVFGAGAGRFGTVWNMYHPLAVNQTSFWNTTFESGYSMLATLIATNGTLVTLALLVVIALSLMLGFRLFNHPFPDRFSRFIAVASLIMFVAFVVLFVVAAPGIVLVIWGFLYLGLLLGVSTLVGRIPVVSINYLKDPRTSFFAILLLAIATMAGFTAAYFSSSRFASVIAYNRALTAPDVSTGLARLDHAIALSPNDIYLRTRGAVFTQQFTAAAHAQTPDKTVLQAAFGQAEQSTRAAVAWDTTDALNWLALSQVYQLITTKDATDAYTAAKSAADAAQTHNPNNPALALNQAQLALIVGDVAGAKDAIAHAITLKSDYLDAYVLRAQIRVANGEATAPIEELKSYIAVAPYDAQGYILLGQAFTATKQYQSALDAYTIATKLDPRDPNAAVGVVDALSALGKKEQALAALDAFAAAFPRITGVDAKRAQLQAVQPPVVDTKSSKK